MGRIGAWSWAGVVVFSWVVAVSGCGSDRSDGGDGDGGPARDGGRAVDAGPGRDAEASDAASRADAGTDANTGCGEGALRCGGTCTDVQSNPAHCGACDRTCPTGQTCERAGCRLPCGFGFTSCTDRLGGERCVDTNSDVGHCGGCGNECTGGATCVSGHCACAEGITLCGSECVSLQRDDRNCGRCGRVCEAGSSCIGADCVPDCVLPEIDCGHGFRRDCADTGTSTRHCGACGRACRATEICNGGNCECPAGLTLCGEVCVDTMTSNTSCGVCGRMCGSDARCAGGVCRPRNDDRANALPLVFPFDGMVADQQIGRLELATFDGPTGCGESTPNVWYSFTLSRRSLVYADVVSSDGVDTKLYLLDAGGATVAGSCNDFGGCNDGVTVTSRDPAFAVVLAPGTYSLAVASGTSTSMPGAYRLSVQRLATNLGARFIETELRGTGVTPPSTLPRGSVRSCRFASSGEDVYWFRSCGRETSSFSLCADSGGSVSVGASPVLETVQGSGLAGSCVAATGCTGTSDTFYRGVSAVVVDDAAAASGMTYQLVYDVH